MVIRCRVSTRGVVLLTPRCCGNLLRPAGSPSPARAPHRRSGLPSQCKRSRTDICQPLTGGPGGPSSWVPVPPRQRRFAAGDERHGERIRTIPAAEDDLWMSMVLFSHAEMPWSLFFTYRSMTSDAGCGSGSIRGHQDTLPLQLTSHRRDARTTGCLLLSPPRQVSAAGVRFEGSRPSKIFKTLLALNSGSPQSAREEQGETNQARAIRAEQRRRYCTAGGLGSGKMPHWTRRPRYIHDARGTDHAIARTDTSIAHASVNQIMQQCAISGMDQSSSAQLPA